MGYCKVVILAVLSDCNEWSEIEDFAYERKDYLKKFLKLTGGIPSPRTYERVISMINPQELNKIFVEFCKAIQEPKAREFKEILSFDGKVEKGSSRQKGLFYDESKPLNVLNVYSDKLEMYIDQEMVEDKTNEIPTVKNIIERLELKDVICTWDALNTQKLPNRKSKKNKRMHKIKVKNFKKKKIRKKNRTSWSIEGAEAILKVIIAKMNKTIEKIISKKAEEEIQKELEERIPDPQKITKRRYEKIRSVGTARILNNLTRDYTKENIKNLLKTKKCSELMLIN